MDELKKKEERERVSISERQIGDMMPQRSQPVICVIINYRSRRFSISRCIFGGLIILLFPLEETPRSTRLKNRENNH